MGTPHPTHLGQEGQFDVLVAGGKGRARSTGSHGQAHGQQPTTDAYIALRQGLRGTGEEKVAAKKPTGKGVLWFGGMAKNLN